jgi:hypothetical protein
MFRATNKAFRTRRPRPVQPRPRAPRRQRPKPTARLSLRAQLPSLSPRGWHRLRLAPAALAIVRRGQRPKADPAQLKCFNCEGMWLTRGHSAFQRKVLPETVALDSYPPRRRFSLLDSKLHRLEQA